MPLSSCPGNPSRGLLRVVTGIFSVIPGIVNGSTSVRGAALEQESSHREYFRLGHSHKEFFPFQNGAEAAAGQGSARVGEEGERGWGTQAEDTEKCYCCYCTATGFIITDYNNFRVRF